MYLLDMDNKLENGKAEIWLCSDDNIGACIKDCLARHRRVTVHELQGTVTGESGTIVGVRSIRMEYGPYVWYTACEADKIQKSRIVNIWTYTAEVY